MRKWVSDGLWCVAAALMLFASLLALGAGDVNANGTPIKIILTYMSGISNTGPKDATGVAEVAEKSGQVSVDVVGLPALTNQTYTGWIVNTKSGDSMNVGSFNTDQSASAKYRVDLPHEIPETGWNLFLLTVESNGPEARSPGAAKSIAGYFPEPTVAAKGPSQLPLTGGDTNPQANSASPARTTVVTLPKSGGLDLGGNPAILVGVVVVAFGLGIVTRSKVGRK